MMQAVCPYCMRPFEHEKGQPLCCEAEQCQLRRQEEIKEIETHVAREKMLANKKEAVG